MAENDTVLAALRKYIRAELDGVTFYRVAADRTADARGKRMFRSLAADEISHARKLALEYDHVMKGGEWISLEKMSSFAEATDEDQLSVFAAGETSILPQIEPRATDLEALQLAIDMEKASYEAYASAAKEAPVPAAREVFESLMKEEQGHLDLLRSTYEYLAKTDSWFEELERPIFEG